MATGMQIVFACEDPNALATFWRLALGYVEEPPPEGYVSWDEFAAAMDLPPDVGEDLASDSIDASDAEGSGESFPANEPEKVVASDG